MFPLEDLGVEVVTLGHVEVADDVIIALALKHVLIYQHIVEVLVVLAVLEVIYDGHLWRVVFEQDLHWHRRHQATAHRHFG